VRIADDDEIGEIIRTQLPIVYVRYENGMVRHVRMNQLTFMEDVPFSVMEGEEDNCLQDVVSPHIRSPNSMGIFAEHLSDNVKELWELIMDPPDELRGELDEAKSESSWDAIQRYCEWNLRWTWREMQTTIAELREICTE
jgi:hypothetical protein